MPRSVRGTIVKFSPLYCIHKLCCRSTAAVMRGGKQGRRQHFFHVVRCVRKKTVPVHEPGSAVGITQIQRHGNDWSRDVCGYAGFRRCANHLVRPVCLQRIGSVKTVGKISSSKGWNRLHCYGGSNHQATRVRGRQLQLNMSWNASIPAMSTGRSSGWSLVRFKRLLGKNMQAKAQEDNKIDAVTRSRCDGVALNGVHWPPLFPGERPFRTYEEHGCTLGEDSIYFD